MQSNAHLGSGFLGGVMSGKSIERLAKNPKAKAVMERIYLKKGYNSKNATRQKSGYARSYKNTRK